MRRGCEEMNDNDKRCLDLLLESSSPDLDEVRAELSRGSLENLIVSDVAGTAAHDIYRIRAQINIDHGRKVRGYDRLLPLLESARSHRIRILWLVLPSKGFRIFVDLDTSTVLGVLSGNNGGGSTEAP